MKTAVMGAILIHCAVCLAFSQSAETPAKFEIADVHVSPKANNQFPSARTGPVRGGRYEVKTATMVDLIRMAYGYNADKILGGPNWLELDRYDVTAKVPAGSTPDSQKEMLQALLEDRFKLKLHKETKPLPTYALVMGKKPQLKQADGTEEAGCKPQTASGPPAEGGMRLMMSNANGVATTFNLGPGNTVTFNCRNMTMEAFVSNMRGMMGANVGQNPILEETGLKGAWNFDLRYSMMMFSGPMGSTGERITVFDAVEKQLGLKLEERQVPTPVIVVDSVDRKPSENPPGVAEALPPIPVPTEFEVASVKSSDPNTRIGRFQTPAGGRLVAEGMYMRFLVSRAFGSFNNDEIVGLPGWVDSERFDITAKAPANSPAQLDQDALAPMIRALLVDRFKMTYHKEERPVTAYVLAAGKPKLKKADPAARTSCKQSNGGPGSPAGSQVLTCQNTTMQQFAERLQNMSSELTWPVADATGLEGGWDFTLTYSRMAAMTMMGGRGAPGGEAGPGGPPMPSASEPTGALTLSEAVEKQLGLKLETRKRNLPVTVIDHLEQKPTEN